VATRSLTRRLVAVSAVAFKLSIAFLPQGSPADTLTSFAANDVEFLNLMGNLEGPRGFATVSDLVPTLPQRPITEMTLAEVLEYQRGIRSLGTVSSAAGRYQFIYPTLSELLERHDITHTLIFDGEVQTYLARVLMHRCGFYERDTHLLVLGNCLAGVWAALPLVSGPLAGESAYAGDGINRALVEPEILLDVLSRRFDW